jgi:hypothetical protein
MHALAAFGYFIALFCYFIANLPPTREPDSMPINGVLDPQGNGPGVAVVPNSPNEHQTPQYPPMPFPPQPYPTPTQEHVGQGYQPYPQPYRGSTVDEENAMPRMPPQEGILSQQIT